jgi:hypothetical protein
MLLVEIDDKKLIPFVKRFGATETKVCSLSSKGRIVVHKDKQMIMSDSSQRNSNSVTDFSISTNAQDMIGIIDKLCRVLWKSSKSLELI